MPLYQAELAAIELKLAQLSIEERRALARRLMSYPKRASRCMLAADRLLVVLRKLRQRTTILPSNRELARMTGINHENVSYLLKILRNRRLISTDTLKYGGTERSFEVKA